MFTQLQKTLIREMKATKVQIEKQIERDTEAGPIAESYANYALCVLATKLGLDELVAEQVSGLADHLDRMDPSEEDYELLYEATLL